nr:gas vesicle protein [Halosolutus gelatinilyticus]
MPHDFQPSRQQSDLAEVIEMLLDKGIVINADIAVSIGDTQLLGVQVRAAIASFETAAKYGLEFPEGTDMKRLAAAVDEPELAEMERPKPPIDATRGVNVTPNPGDEGEGDGDRESDGGESSDGDASYEEDRVTDRVGKRPDPERPTSGGFDLLSTDSEGGDGAADGDGEGETADADDASGEDASEAESAPESEGS